MTRSSLSEARGAGMASSWTVCPGPVRSEIVTGSLAEATSPETMPPTSRVSCAAAGEAAASARARQAPQRKSECDISPLLQDDAILAARQVLDQRLDLLLSPLWTRRHEPVGAATLFRWRECDEAPVGKRLLDQRQRHDRLAQPCERRAQRLSGVSDLEQHLLTRVLPDARMAWPGDPSVGAAGSRDQHTAGRGELDAFQIAGTFDQT